MESFTSQTPARAINPKYIGAADIPPPPLELKSFVQFVDKSRIVAKCQLQLNRHKTNAKTPSIGGINNRIPIMHSILFPLIFDSSINHFIINCITLFFITANIKNTLILNKNPDASFCRHTGVLSFR